MTPLLLTFALGFIIWAPPALAFVLGRQEIRPHEHRQDGIVISPAPIRSTSSARHMTILSKDQAVHHPTPELDALQVVTICMDALQLLPSNDALATCFEFSSDRCRAAVGGTLEQFVKYADNPVFGTLVNCDSYRIVSAGPIIAAASNGLGSRRGEMQTFLVEISTGMTMKTVRKEVEQGSRKRPTVEERLRLRELQARGESVQVEGDTVVEQHDDGKRRFLWTLQKEVRPPRQDCWLVHEVLFTKNAIHQTY